MKKNAPNSFSRKHIRYKADHGKYAQVQFSVNPRGFKCEAAALIFSESYGGCGLVLLGDAPIRVGDFIYTRVGELSPMRAEVVWKKTLDEDSLKIGIRYIE